MAKQRLQKPMTDIDTFFSDFNKEAAKKNLWELYRGWMMSERSRNCDPALPADILFFYVQVNMLIEASWEIQASSMKKQHGRTSPATSPGKATEKLPDHHNQE
jgi:hypothetical protein